MCRWQIPDVLWPRLLPAACEALDENFKRALKSDQTYVHMWIGSIVGSKGRFTLRTTHSPCFEFLLILFEPESLAPLGRLRAPVVLPDLRLTRFLPRPVELIFLCEFKELVATFVMFNMVSTLVS